MKELFIKKLKPSKKMTLQEVGHLLDTQTVANPIDALNWKDYSYKPKVLFRIGHTENEICLKYEVDEKHILAQETRTNGEVYKDSTCEFFISVDGRNYYNFEFSCIGTIHLAHGPGRGNRTFVPEELIKKIRIESTLGTQPFAEKTGNFHWELVVCIPAEVFRFDSIKSFNGLKATANFYKCGDGTATPHYITWNPVETSQPDYHRPEYFGKVIFE